MASLELRLSSHVAKLVKCRSNKEFPEYYGNERLVIQLEAGVGNGVVPKPTLA